jgi:hypothetical protein
MINIEAIDIFKDACDEIHILIDYSQKNKTNLKRYATFNKAAIVLLCAKFEACLEGFLEEYIYFHIDNSSNLTLNRDIYEHLVDCVIDTIEINRKDITKRGKNIKALTDLCGMNEVKPLSNYQFNSKLKFGKHGQNEVQRLLNSFGFSSYVGLDESKTFFRLFNSLNNIRNNIVHEDATPSLTHQDVKMYLSTVSKFVIGLKDEAIGKMELIVV